MSYFSVLNISLGIASLFYAGQKMETIHCRRLTLILQNIDIFAKGVWLLCLVVVTTCPYIWPRSKCKIPSQWNHQNKAKLFLELQDGVSVDQNVDTKSLNQHQIFSTIMYQVSFKALRSNTETERFFQTLTQTICNICHVIVHFLSKKHCFWPKKALLLPKDLQNVRKSRKILIRGKIANVQA